MAFASKLVSLSSTNSIFIPVRPWSWLANFRARVLIALSVSSMLRGKPTRHISGCHSSSIWVISCQSGAPSFALSIHSSVAMPDKTEPVATPICLSPKSKAITCLIPWVFKNELGATRFHGMSINAKNQYRPPSLPYLVCLHIPLQKEFDLRSGDSAKSFPLFPAPTVLRPSLRNRGSE